jgi:hypothetical protein
VTKTIKVSETNYQALEALRVEILKEKITSGKLERTDATFDEVITRLLEK